MSIDPQVQWLASGNLHCVVHSGWFKGGVAKTARTQK